MGNEVQVQKTAGGLTFKVPPHLLAKMVAKGGNISTGGVSRNALLIEGKQWAASVGSDVKVFTRPVIIQMPDGTYGPDPDGAREPVPTLDVVVIDQSARGHTYYPGTYVKGQGSAPACWSEDGRKPSANVAEPKSKACDECPMSKKGSAENADYPNMKACSDVKRLAVQVCSQRGIEWSIPPLSLKLAISSIWDERDQPSMNDGWYAWDNYTRFLADNKCTRTNSVVTRMRFGSGTLNVQFKLISFVEEADYDKTEAMADTDEVKGLLTIFGGAPAKPQGKALPKDDELSPGEREVVAAAVAENVIKRTPDPEVVAAAQALRAKEEAEAKAAADFNIARLAAAAKAKKIADAKAALAALEAEEGGFDDGPKAPAPTVVDTPAEAEKKRTRRTRAEMEAARAAEAAAKAPPTALRDPDMTQVIDKAALAAAVAAAEAKTEATTASAFAPVEIPAELADQLPAWN